MYKLAIFDFDGTLVDSVPGIQSVMKDVIEELHLPSEVFLQWSHLVGMPLMQQMEILFPDQSQEFHKNIANRYRILYDKHLIEYCPPFPGLKTMLSSLHAQAIHIAIATSKRGHIVQMVIDHHNLSHYFKLIVDPQHVANHKPHPESVHFILDKLQIEQKDAVVIGDSTFDLDMARNAGVDAIGVTTGIHTYDLLHKSAPQHIVNGLPEVTRIILNGRKTAH